jgi:Glycosyl transferase family 2
VLASVEAEENIEASLHALQRTCRGTNSEIIVVDASQDRSAEIARAAAGPFVVLTMPVGTITPHLWGEGVRRSTGRWVALTTAHCIVPEAWLSELDTALDGGAAAAGAGLLPDTSADFVDLAVFFLRYHAFVEITTGPQRPTPEVPGDNAAYCGEAARDFVADPSAGFFEIDFHRKLRTDGRLIVAVPPATAVFAKASGLRTMARHRFLHGRQFGAWRTRSGGESRLLMVLKAPFVPAVLMLRAWRNVRAVPGLRTDLVRAAVAFLFLATAWSMGEAAGAVSGSSGGQPHG